MLQRFKLRLGDGTVLLVDHGGLSTWLVDRKAMVQAGRSGKWIPLREFLVQLRAAELREARERAARPEERERAAEREEEERAAEREERRREAEREERRQAAPHGEEERATEREERMRAAARAERRRTAEREGRRQAAARGATPPPTTPPPREDGLPLVPPPPTDEAASPNATPPPRGDELPLVPPPPRDATAAPPQEDDGPFLVPPPPTEEAPAVPSPPEEETPSPPRSDEFEVPLNLGASSESAADVRISVGEPRLVRDEAPAGPTLTDPASEDEPAVIGEPPGVQALADEPAPVAPGSTPMDDVPVVPPRPLEDEGPGRPAGPPQAQRTGSTWTGAAWDDEDEGPGRPAEPPRAAETPSVMERPGVQSLADDPVASPARRTGSTWTGATWDDEAPVIPLKPLDEQVSARRPATPRFRPASPAGEAASVEAVWRDGPAASALRAVGKLGTFLSRCLTPINRLERGLSQHPVELEEPTPAADEPAEPSTGPSIRLIPYKSLQEGFSGLSTRARGLVVRARGWLEDLTAQLSRRLRHEGPPDSSPPERLAAAAPPPPPDSRREPRVVPQAPPALDALPRLRLKPVDEPQREEDIYGEDLGGERADFVSAIRVWTRRLVWAAVLLGLGTLAAMNRNVWLPQAADLGERTLNEIDEQVRSGHFAYQQQRAVEEAARQIPHLAPETIRMIMASSSIRVLDAPDVFDIACEATDRGLPALTPGEARELERLRRDLIGGLGPEDQGQIREFERARARGTAFPFDVRQGLRLYSRGARELPPEKRERLQVLLGQAIAAGLASPTEAERSTPNEPPL